MSKRPGNRNGAVMETIPDTVPASEEMDTEQDRDQKKKATLGADLAIKLPPLVPLQEVVIQGHLHQMLSLDDTAILRCLAASLDKNHCRVMKNGRLIVVSNEQDAIRWILQEIRALIPGPL